MAAAYNLAWKYANNRFTAQLTNGIAIIEEIRSGNSASYKPIIENLAGVDVIGNEMIMDDFGLTEEILEAHLIRLDYFSDTEKSFEELLCETLDMCIDLLADPAREFHRIRLQNIKAFYLGKSQVKPDDALKTDWYGYKFEWGEAILRYAFTCIHGKVIIFERDKRYFIELQDITGAVLSEDFYPHPDFAAAENRLRELLSEIEHPYMGEEAIPCINYTLEICRRSLPENIDLRHRVRLDYIEADLGEALP
jgi:hypothetical protein